MKSFLLALVLLSTASSSPAQSLVYYNRINVGNGPSAPIYGPEPDNPSLSKVGNTSAGRIAGTQTYGGAPLTGTGYTASLWYGFPGQTEVQLRMHPDSLKPFRTGMFAGAINNSGGVLPFFGLGGSLALQWRVWDNEGGTILTWEDAVFVGAMRGASPVFISPYIMEGAPPPNMVGLVSFNIYQPVPEPRAWMLGGCGMVLLVFGRRFKRSTGTVATADISSLAFPATQTTLQPCQKSATIPWPN
jgi:hypothetical protein